MRSKALDQVHRLLESVEKSPYTKYADVGSPQEVKGRRVVNLLLNGRRIEQLTAEELACLVIGYEWWGKPQEVVKVYKVGLTRMPESVDFLHGLDSATWNLYVHERWKSGSTDVNDTLKLIAMYDQYILEQLGPPGYWHLRKADWYEWIAIDKYPLEWKLGEPIVNPDALELAIREIQQALEVDPTLAQGSFPDWWEDEEDWHQRYYVLSSEPKYHHLLPK
jgi:hypothetical protein